LPSGNPPSGAASGYVLFDIVAIALTARLLQLLQARPLEQPLSSGRGIPRPYRVSCGGAAAN
jgi:hypothetical protein